MFGNLFGKKRKKQSQSSSEAPGWDAITAAFEALYPGQTNPKHYGTLVKWEFGGNDPLDGISIYDGGDYWHFVTYGLSDLYEKTSKRSKQSGYGMELTFKLKKDDHADEEAEIECVCGILQHIARITFTQNEIFSPFEYIYTGQTVGIDAQQKSALTGFITVPEPKIPPIDTPNGRVVFVELIGVTDAELRRVYQKQSNVGELYRQLGSDVTDYNRGSVV